MRGLKLVWVGLLGCGPLVPGDSTGGDGETGETPPGPTTQATTRDATSTTTTSPTDPTTGGDDTSTGCATACGSDDSGQDSLSFIDGGCDAGFGLTHCQPGMCDPWAQDCPDGEKCSAWSNEGGEEWNSVRCSVVDSDNAQPGDACMVEGNGYSGADNCALGSMCWNVDPKTNQGTCVALCTGSEDLPICDDPEFTCAVTNEGVLNLCLPSCDPLESDCPDGQGCYPLGGDATFVCAPTGNGITVDSRHPTHCAAGTIDVGNDLLSTCELAADPCCATLCDLDTPACAEGLTCTPFYDDDDIPPVYIDIGVCLG